MSDKIPPMPTGKHVSSAKKESLSSLRRSSSANQLPNGNQSEASLSEKNRILVTEVDRLKCLVHEKQNRISELDDENYQFRDYINRLEQQASRLKESYNELEAKHAQLEYDQQKLETDYNQLLESQANTCVETDEQIVGVQKFFKYVQRIASDVNKMMQYKKYLNSSSLNLPSRPSILSNSVMNSSLSNSFRQSGRSNRRSSLLIHDQNVRRSREEPMPLTLTSTIEREESFEKSSVQDQTQENQPEEVEDQSMNEEDENAQDSQIILDTQQAESGLQAIEEESECDQEETRQEEKKHLTSDEEESEEEDEENEMDEEEEEEEEEMEEVEETVEETEEIEETVQSSDEDEDDEEKAEQREETVNEMTKNYTYLVNETHNVNKTFDVAVKTPEPVKKSVKFECNVDESIDHTKFAKTPFREQTKPIINQEETNLENTVKKKKKSILKVRTSDPEIVPNKSRDSCHQTNDIEKEIGQKSIFKTKKNTPSKNTNEVNKYLEDLVDEAAQNDKENSKKPKVKNTPKTKNAAKKIATSSDTDNSSDDDFVLSKNKNQKNKTKMSKVGLPPLPGKKPKRPIESVYENKQVLKQTQNLCVKVNSCLSISEQSKELNDLDNSSNNRSPTINNLLSKKLRLSPDSEDSNDTSQPIMGETNSARRARKAVSYKELPINTKIRRDKDNRVCIKKITCKISNPNEDLVKYSKENH